MVDGKHSVFNLVFALLIYQHLVYGQFSSFLMLRKHLDIACRFNNICKPNNSETVWPGKYSTKCCRDCSCQDDCGLSNNCCYPELDKYNIREKEQCVIPSRRFRTQDSENSFPFDRAYYMTVDASPRYFCVNGEADDYNKCGDDETATPFGSLYPVFSPETQKIYKNIKCAECHGLSKSNVIPWDVVIQCISIDPNIQPDLNTYYQSLESGVLPPFCRLKFEKPNSLSDLSMEECYSHAVHTCLPNGSFFIPKFLNMSHEDIRNACYTDLQSPFAINDIVYANVFCYICNRQTPVHSIPVGCEPNDIKDLTIPLPFSTFLSAEYIYNQKTNKDETSTHNPRVLCNDKEINAVSKDCRYVHCPSGMLIIKRGTCVYPSRNSTVKVGLVLKLLPNKAVSIESFKNFTLYSWTSPFVVSPWGDDLKYTAFKYPKYKSQREIDYILLHAVHEADSKTKSFDAQTLMPEVENKLKKTWTIYSADGPIQLEQVFSEFDHLIQIKNTSFRRFSFNETAVRVILQDSMINMTFPIFESLNYFHYQDFVKINKLFYCDQIALKSHEYNLDKVARLLYHKKTQRLFYDNEFSLIYDMTLNDYVPRVCLSDSGFSHLDRLYSNCSLKLQHFCNQHSNAGLAVVESAAENALLVDYAHRLFKGGNFNGHFWIGGSDDEIEGVWVWVPSHKLMSDGFTYWQPGQPENGTPNEDCLCLHPTAYYWHDCICTEKNHPLCEKNTTIDGSFEVIG